MDLCGDDIEKEMKEWRKKLKITHFCINLLNIIINKMKKVYSLNEQKEIINYSYKDILNMILKEDYEFDDVDVDESNLENSENDDEMNCRENEKIKIKKENIHKNKSETKNESIKDCVEYGLIGENIICTKYK